MTYFLTFMAGTATGILICILIVRYELRTISKQLP